MKGGDKNSGFNLQPGQSIRYSSLIQFKDKLTLNCHFFATCGCIASFMTIFGSTKLKFVFVHFYSQLRDTLIYEIYANMQWNYDKHNSKFCRHILM